MKGARVQLLCMLNDGIFIAEEQHLCPASDPLPVLNDALTHGKLSSQGAVHYLTSPNNVIYSLTSSQKFSTLLG